MGGAGWLLVGLRKQPSDDRNPAVGRLLDELDEDDVLGLETAEGCRERDCKESDEDGGEHDDREAAGDRPADIDASLSALDTECDQRDENGNADRASRVEPLNDEEHEDDAETRPPRTGHSRRVKSCSVSPSGARDVSTACVRRRGD